MLYFLGASLTILLLSALFVVFLYFHPLPKVQGELRAQGLSEPVMVRRDPYGYVQIEATSVADAVFAHGFVHAQDRLWQMELNRRVGSGRMSEAFGSLAVNADIFLRRLGLRRAAEADLAVMEPEERAILEAYCAGVNAGRKALGWRLPLEFRLLNLEPEPWTPLDSLTWIQVMSMDLCANWEQELLRGKILDKLGVQGATLLQLFTRDGAVTVPPEDIQDRTALFDRLSELYQEAKSFMPNGGLPGASNAWVVAGRRSASGRPLLASDPHLMGRVPCIWHEVHLLAPGLDVQGVAFPGFPLVVIGHNQKVAWGVTNSFADTQDLFIERFDSEHPNLVETEAGWVPLEVRQETILVKGSEAVVEAIEVSRHGPIMVRDETGGLALRWVNHQPSHPIATMLAMNRAQSCAEFKQALRTWQAPSSNFVYADVEGNIGYLMAGHIPMRKNGTGLTPVPGWNDDYDWTSMIPFEELPSLDNPDCGYVVTANNPVVDSSFPHHITWDWMGSSRASRIESLILARESHNVEHFAAMQMDFHSELGLRFALAFEPLVVPAGKGEAKVLDILRFWDGDGGAESTGMAVYQVLILTTLKALLEPIMGDDLFAEFLGSPSNPLSVMGGHTGRYTTWLVGFLENPEQFAILEHSQTLCEVTAHSLTEATNYLENRLGPDPARWSWGKLHRLGFQHALGINRFLSAVLNGPVIPIGGDTDTVFQTAVIPHQAFSQAWCPSWRQVVDLAALRSGLSVLPTGQSGHPASKNYMDQFQLWRQGQLRSHPTDYVNNLELKP